MLGDTLQCLVMLGLESHFLRSWNEFIFILVQNVFPDEVWRFELFPTQRAQPLVLAEFLAVPGHELLNFLRRTPQP